MAASRDTEKSMEEDGADAVVLILKPADDAEDRMARVAAILLNSVPDADDSADAA